MDWLWGIPRLLVFGFDVVGPALILLWVKKRTGRWRPAILFSAWTATVFALIFTATVGWLSTVFQSAVEPVYYMALLRAPVAGIYGALISTTIYLLVLALVGLSVLLQR